MGKQRDKTKRASTRPESTNVTDWEKRVRQLVRAGILPPLYLDKPHLAHTPHK